MKLEFILLFTLMFACSSMAGENNTGSTRDFTISAASVIGGAEPDGRLIKFFVQRLPMVGDFSAQFAQSCDWRQIPSGIDAKNHVNLLKLEFGRRLELLALMLESDGGSVALAARAPALMGQVGIYYHPYYAPPGDYQLPANAPADLVNAFAFELKDSPGMKGYYQLILSEWEREGGVEAAPTAQPGKSLPRAAGLADIYPLAAAAMYAERYGADMRPREDVIELGIAVGVLTYDIRAELREGAEKIREVIMPGVRPEQLYDSLRILILNLIEWRGAVIECVNPDVEVRGGFEPLYAVKKDAISGGFAHEDAVVVAATANALFAFNFGANELVWDTFADRKRLVPAYRGNRIFEYDANSIRRISRSAGNTEFTISEQGVQESFQFDACEDITVTGVFNELSLYDRETEVWRLNIPSTILAGPAIQGKSVVLCDDQGWFRSFSLQGEEEWSVQLPSPIRGWIHAAGGMFFGCDKHGMLTAVKADGKLAWRSEIGDVVAGAPHIMDGVVLAPSKSRHLFLFDKSTGERLKEYEFPTLLLGTRVIGDKLFCIDMRRQLTVFDAATLVPEKTFRFPFALNPGIIAVTDFSFFRSRTGIEARTDGLLVSDRKGFIYYLSLP